MKSYRYFGGLTGLLMVPEEVPDDQIMNFLTCKDISAIENKSILKEYKKTGNIFATEQAHGNACEDGQETHLKLFEKKRGGTQGMALCQRLGGYLSSPLSLYDEIIQQGNKQDCEVIWVPISYDTTVNKWKGDADYILTTNLIWSKNYPKKSDSRRCAYLNMHTATHENDRCEVEQCHYCYLTKTIHFNLYSICKDSIIDQSYSIYVDKLTDIIHWNGFGKTNLIKNVVSKQWEIVQVHKPFKVLGRTLQDFPEDELGVGDL